MLLNIMSIVPNKAPTVYVKWTAAGGTAPNPFVNGFGALTNSSDGTVVVYALRVVATGVSSVFYSTDSGRTYTQTPTGSGSEPTSVYGLACVNNTGIYVASINSGIFLYTIGSPGTWSSNLVTGNIGIGLGNTDIFSHLACSTDGRYLYASSSNLSSGVGTIWKGTYSGSAWTWTNRPNISGGSSQIVGMNVNYICCSTDGRIVCACIYNTTDTYASQDYGVTYVKSTVISALQIACSSNGTVVLVPGVNSINISVDSGTSYVRNSFGQSTTWLGGYVSQDGTKLYVVDGGGNLYYSPDVGSTWRIITSDPSSIGGGNALTIGSNGYPRTVVSSSYVYYGDITVLCFKEGTKILCFVDGKETYLPIQDMKAGTLVKTSLDGYKKVDMIGHSKIYNPGHSLRGKDRLYKCTNANYPEVTEDLVITGCHSILVDNLTDEQRKDVNELAGRIFVTDNKYRLMACLDDRALPYTEEGLHTIWHFALENDNFYYNYGVYANGLLVETTSQRMMKELSGMELV